jgi:squalene-hopene/tetraprenyl-beta-curcumene cyclase
MRILALTFVLLIVTRSSSAEELTLDNVAPPTANSADEPLATAFSLDNATRFLDQASLDWTKSRKCFTCHTNFSYLIARPSVSAEGTAHRQVREALEEMVEKRWETDGPRWNAEVVMSAAVLAMNDAATSGKLHATTRKALDRMWTLQRADGGFDWLKCGWPPMESDDDYGIAIAALATGTAPEDYAKNEAARAGMHKLRDYLKANPPPTLHHTAMLLWADRYGTKLLTPAERDATKDKLFALQKPDGGWSLATLGNWARGDGSEQDTSASDGYGTGFVVFVLRQAGIAADDVRLQKGVSWLKQHQRESGRWYSRSLNKDSKHFISHAGTAFAVMAIQACEPE